MDQKIKNAIESAVKNEPLARTFKIQLVKLDTGISAVEMIYEPDRMNNIYDPHLKPLRRPVSGSSRGGA